MNTPDIIRYFRACYEADNSRTGLWNLFGSTVEDVHILDGPEELLTGIIPYLPLPRALGQALQKKAHLYSKEKELIYGSLFIVGKLRREDQAPQTVCAPLIYLPARIIDMDGDFYVEPIDVEGGVINRRLLDAVQSVDADPGLADTVETELSTGLIDYPCVAAVQALLQRLAPDVACQDITVYPERLPESTLKAVLKQTGRKRSTDLNFLPVSAIALIKKSTETRGVLNELAELAGAAVFSTPLQTLLGEQPPLTTERPHLALHRVPAVLSKVQELVLGSAAHHPLTLVVGPPGTGKSYTIAAIAIEHLSRGQSVLVGSKMNHAVDVVGVKIEAQLGLEGCVVRGGRKQYLRDLKRYLKELLSGMHGFDAADETRLVEIQKELPGLDRAIERLQKRIEETSACEIDWGANLATPDPHFFAQLRQKYILWKTDRSQPLWELVQELEQHVTRRIRLVAQMVRLQMQRRIQKTLRDHRREFSTFSKAIRARTGTRQANLFDTIDLGILLKAFPIWLVNLSDIHDVLPFQTELFDVAIIDEATQCDIACSLPVLQRARRTIVFGDPNQLRHITFLARDRQRQFLRQFNLPDRLSDPLNYRDNSLLDFVNDSIVDQNRVMFLNEHFRSEPDIIGFSNRAFYAGALQIMTHRPDTIAHQSLRLTYCGGQRSQSGVNRIEAETLITDVVEQVKNEAALPLEACHSIGILSPFRDQVDFIEAELAQRVSLDALRRHDILIGTAHTFQGEERDWMYLSLAADPASHGTTLRFLNQPGVFNVTVTRARIRQSIYTSLDEQRLPAESLVRRYLVYAREMQQAPPSPTASRAYHDRFLTEVKAALSDSGLSVWSAYPVAGIEMDVMISDGHRSMGIDLIGYPGAFAGAFSLERYQMFHRAGLPVFALPYSRWTLDRETCVAAIRDYFGPF